MTQQVYWSYSHGTKESVRIQTWIENLPDESFVVIPPNEGNADCICMVDLGAKPVDGYLRSIGRHRFEPLGEARDWARNHEIETVQYGQHGIFAMIPESAQQKFTVRMRWM